MSEVSIGPYAKLCYATSDTVKLGDPDPWHDNTLGEPDPWHIDVNPGGPTPKSFIEEPDPWRIEILPPASKPN